MLRFIVSRTLISVLFFSVFDAAPSMAALAEQTVPFVGGSATAGERFGIGAFAGAAHLTCDVSFQGCLGYGLHAGHRFSDPSASFIEAGGVGLLSVIPVYAGFGVRMKGLDVAGGQISVATGVLPMFLIVRAYNENSNLSAEIGLGLLWPLGPIRPLDKQK